MKAKGGTTKKKAPGKAAGTRVAAPDKGGLAKSTPSDEGEAAPLVIAIGASAGGLNAFSTFLQNMPTDTGMAFILVQHLAPEHKSMMPEILRRTTEMAVVEAKDGMRVAPNTVYVIPPNATLTVRQLVLRVLTPAPPREQRRPIDTFFSSLAEDQGENAVCIILSGTGSDGTDGLKVIKDHGGFALAQAEFDNPAPMSGMPHSAAATGLVDEVIPVEKMPAKLIEYQKHLRTVAQSKDGEGLRRDTAEYLSKITALLRARVGHDFTEYKEKTLIRRIQRRMQILHVPNPSAYVTRLREQPSEVELLFRELLINVTSFFRDPAAFVALEKAIEKLFETKSTTDNFRIWVPACATGEEVYSIAVLVSEVSDRLGQQLRVQIFGTDIDDVAVAFARAGKYRDTNGLSNERLARWFERDGHNFGPIKRIRTMCVFSTHSVAKDPPFSKLDLISCRNLMIYLDASLQDRVLQTFHYALIPGGLLFLGIAEGVARMSAQFGELDRKHRIFMRRDNGAVRFPTPAPRMPVRDARQAPRSFQSSADQVEQRARLALAKHALVYVVIDRNDQILTFSGGETGRYLEPSSGAASLNLFAIVRKDLRRIVRTAVSAVRDTGKPVVRDDVSLEIEDQGRLVRVIVEPIAQGNESRLCVVAFQDLGVAGRRRNGRAHKGPETGAEALRQELNATRTQLQSAIEELELTTEEMRSSVEEYQSVNEELQSSNEELETAKEEMQSVNEELQTVNSELLSKGESTARLNSDLKNFLDSTRIATVFLDADLRIKNFTPSITDIFRLREGDLDRPITEIVTPMVYGEPSADLKSDVQSVLLNLTVIEREVRLPQKGAIFMMRMRPYRSIENVITGVVITFVDVTQLKHAQEESAILLAELDHRVKNILAIVSSIVSQTLKEGTSNAESTLAVERRIAAIARAHNLVMRKGRLGEAPLRDIIVTELAPYDHGDNLIVQGCDVMLKSKAAMALILAIHELASNAVKYGSLSSGQGRLVVKWTVVENEAERMLKLVWTESGGPIVKEPLESGFGSKLIHRSLVHGFDAKVEREFRESGLCCRIELLLTEEVGYTRSPAEVLR